jgi:release factor glutamine methyltransferase
VTVLELIQRTSEFLKRKGVDSPRLQAELLLAHVLHLPRMQLYLNFEKKLAPAELDQFREFVRRRGQREPLQHIVGSVSFCGYEIGVNRHVLVPRPETELLAECGWQFLNECAKGQAEPLNVLDYGTGSGCLAIALASKCPLAEIQAVDVSEQALGVARQNAARNNVASRVHFHTTDGVVARPADLLFKLIISNPPYIATAQIERLQPEVRDYDPRPALDGGPDGLHYYRRLSVESVERLEPEGRIMLELGDDQAEAVRDLFQAQNWIVERIAEDYTQRPRIMIARKCIERRSG